MTQEAIYRTYKDSVYRICLRYTKNSDDALDLMQDTFIKVFKSFRGFNNKSELFTWVYRIAANTCIDYLRKISSRPEGLSEIIETLPEKSCNFHEVDVAFTLNKVLSGIDSKDREALFLTYIEGLGQEEVASVMGVSRSAVSKRLKKYVTAFLVIFCAAIISEINFLKVSHF
jgi:RNA polymerase sigma-70 factor, ECF subfamily